MTRRPTRKTTSRKSARAGKTRKAAAPRSAQSPLTLAEARRLAGGTIFAAGAARTPAPEPPRPAAIAREEKMRKRAADDERTRRRREYKAVMSLMQKRGAARPAPGGIMAQPAAASGFAPLRIFAEGDSWFDYPPHFFSGGIVPRLANRLGVPILNLASAGDEVRFMLGVEQRARIIAEMSNGSPSGGAWDAMLFSGGGNDVVDKPMVLWLRDWNASIPPVQHIVQKRFDAALALVRSGYEELIALRDALSPGTHLFFHQYDFAIPNGAGVCGKGPWLKPSFDARGFPAPANLSQRRAVVKEMLMQFAAMQAGLPKKNVTIVQTQGKLPASGWDNELHPTSSGFDMMADLFRDAVKAKFPDRVV